LVWDLIEHDKLWCSWGSMVVVAWHEDIVYGRSGKVDGILGTLHKLSTGVLNFTSMLLSP
jgi:hypothetical protein